jgi:LacI family transcriptional regulator
MGSIKEIARKARVSIGTVDRVLHNRGRVSQETRKRIQRIVADVGYKPNMFARHLSLGKTFHFGVLMPKPSQDSGYWSIPTKGIERAKLQLAPVQVDVDYFHFDRYSEHSFELAFRKALNKKLDGLLIAPVLQHIAQTLVSSIPCQIPYVFIDSTIPGTNCLATIGQDPFQSGLLAANLMKRMHRKGGSIAVVKVTPEDFHINERLRGFEFGIGSDSSICTRRYEADSRGGGTTFRALVEKILRENTELNGVYVSNAWTHPFAHFFNILASDKKICIIGYDLVGKNREYLENGMIDFLISQRPGMQGYEGIQALYRHVVLRDKVKKTSLVPLDIITKDNVKYYQD